MWAGNSDALANNAARRIRQVGWPTYIAAWPFRIVRLLRSITGPIIRIDGIFDKTKKVDQGQCWRYRVGLCRRQIDVAIHKIFVEAVIESTQRGGERPVGSGLLIGA